MSRSAPSGAGATATRRREPTVSTDRRLGRLSARRAPVDEVARVLELFDTRYWDFTAKLFHEKLVADHGFKRSYNWLRLSLQAHGRRRAAPRRGGAPAHAAAPCPARHDVAPGRLEPRVGPRSMVGPDRHHGRCDQRYLVGLLRRRRGHHVELPGGGYPEVAEQYLPIIHLVFANLKTWLIGIHHGVSHQHLQAYLNEFTFRFNRRFYPFNAFRSLLGIAGDTSAPTYAELYSGEWRHPTCSGHGR